MHPSPQFQLDGLQLSALPLANRAPHHCEPPITSLLATDVREAQKIEGLRLPFTTPRSIAGRPWAKLDDARFLGMQFQFELGKSFRQFMMKPCGVRLVLKTHHEVIGPA